MSTTPTNNPVPSESPRDLKFNAGKIDEFVTSLVNTYVDRFGNEHYTIEGLRWLAQQAIAQYGWILLDSFQDGADITLPNQALRDEDTGEYYRWDGALPKHVDAGSTPASSGGVGVGAWIGIGDASLRAMLATASGAGMVGATDKNGNPSTVQDELDALHGQTSHIGGDISLTDSVVTAGTYSEMEFVGDLPHYTAGFSIPKNSSLPYDHFGLIMKTRDGRILTFFRRASIHTGSADAAIMKSELLSTGWSVPVQVISSPGLDVRCASGGVMPNGNIVLCINLMQSDNTPRDVVFYRSRDCGETWELIQTIPVSQSAGYAYTIPYGQFAVMGNKVVIPFYKRVDTVFSVSFFQTTDNGDSWTVGPNIYSGANDYNETQIACIGRYAIAISRVASGIGTKFHIFTSIDGGATWVDQGDSNFTGGDTGYVVAPTLYVRRTKSGTPYILFLYVDRSAQILFYRYSQLTRIIAGDYTFSEKYRVTGNMTNSSGYQSGFFEGNRLIGIVWKETSPQTAAQGDSFEIFTPDIPDYDSGWISVAALQNYTLATGYNQKLKDLDVFFSPDANAGTIHKVSTGQVSTSGSGAGVALTDTQVIIRTGAYPYSNSLFGSSGGTNYTTGYYRVYGWL